MHIFSATKLLASDFHFDVSNKNLNTIVEHL